MPQDAHETNCDRSCDVGDGEAIAGDEGRRLQTRVQVAEGLLHPGFASLTPFRHLNAFFEPEGKDYESQLPNTTVNTGNTNMNFDAYLTENALDLNTWHDMEASQHHQFGTVDNPVLVFTTTPAGICKDAALSNDASGGSISSGNWINGNFNTF